MHACVHMHLQAPTLHVLCGFPRRTECTPGAQDPVGDFDIIHNELRLKDLERVNGVIESINKLKSRGLKKDQIEELECCERLKAWLEASKDIRWVCGLHGPHELL